MVFDQEKRVVTSINQVKSGDKLKIRVADGTIDAGCEKTEPLEPDAK